MKYFLERVTLIRIFCLLLFLIWLWILFSPKSDHSYYHVDILVGLAIVFVVLLLLEYLIKRRVKNIGKLLLFESIIIAALIGLWFFIVS